ncbi:MAG: M28 family peptidase [Candidatus Helarchaeota archaeon]
MVSIEQIQGEKLYEQMLEFIRIGWRRPGTPEAHKTAELILKKFEEFGLEDTKLEPFEMLLYSPKQWSLTLKCDSLPGKETTIDCIPTWHSASSDIGGTEAELVYVGLGTEKEFKKCVVAGKIVIVDSFRMMAFYPSMDFFRVYERARKRGAVGLIGIHDTPPGTIFAEYCTRHQTLKDSNLESGNIPALYIGFESGQYIKALMKAGEQFIVKLLLRTEIKPVMTDNLIGTLPGRKPDEIILIGTHIDSWFDGAIDNAGGNAGFLEIAKYFSQVPKEERRKTMVFAGFAGHEVGSIGVIEFARKHHTWFDKIMTYCMIDGFGSTGFNLESPTRGVVPTGLDEAKGLFTTDNQILFEYLSDAVFKYHLFPAMHVSAVAGPYSDLGPLVAAKVPSIMLIGKGIFYHTIADTADKVVPDQLERTAKAHLEILEKIHQTPINTIKEADRKGIILPANRIPGKRGQIYFNFHILPNPMIKGTTALIYLTSYRTTSRIIVDMKWNILSLLDNFGHEYSLVKKAYVMAKSL